MIIPHKYVLNGSYIYIVTVSPLNPSGYIRIKGSTETLICMDPLNWHRLTINITRSQVKVQILYICLNHKYLI